jgi:hypothetical protein
MKGVTKFFTTTIITLVTLFMILFVNDVYAQNSVSGTVRFIDNNEPLSSGTVQAYDLACNLIASTSINTDGTYEFASLPPISTDIIAFPDVSPDDEDFVPTIHPDKTDWQNAVPINPSSPLSDIDIYVERIIGGDYPFTASINGTITLNNKPIKDAIIYAKRDNQFFGYGITNDRGEYEINSLPQGDYILVIHRIGASSATRTINLTINRLTNINFNLEEAPFGFKNTAPKEFELSQNYPNPFNPATKINYSVLVQGKVKLSVYNSMGQLVDVLVNEVQASGSYSVSFNGSSLSSGVYLYRIESGSFTETKKMILIK